MKLGYWAEAETAMSDALRLKPRSWLVLVNLGRLWLRRNDKGNAESLRAAVDWHTRAAALKRDAVTLTLLGAALRRQMIIPLQEERLKVP